MRQIIYDKVRNISEKYKGYIDTEDLMKEGLTNRQIGLLTAEEKLEKIAHGHYWVNSDAYGKPEDYKAVEVARVNENAVICADSACYYMGLIDVEPQVLSIATKRSDRHKMKMNFDVCRHYFSEKAFEEDQKVFHLMTYLEETLNDEDYLYFVPAAILFIYIYGMINFQWK